MVDEVENQVNPVEEKPPEAPVVDLVKAELDTLKQKISTYDGQLRKQNSELQKYKQLVESRDSDQGLVKAMLEVLASQKNQPIEEVESTVRANQTDLVKQFEERIEQTKKARQLEEFNNRVADYQQKTLDAGLTENDDAYWKIYDYARQGQFRRADIEIDRLSRVKEVPKVVEQPKVDIEKQIEEKARKLLEEKGLLKTEPGGPSAPAGVKYTIKQIEAMNPKEYIKLFPNGFADVMQGIKEGKIKE